MKNSPPSWRVFGSDFSGRSPHAEYQLRDPKLLHCRVIMQNGKLFAPLPKLAPPPKEFTREQWRISSVWERVK